MPNLGDDGPGHKSYGNGQVLQGSKMFNVYHCEFQSTQEAQHFT